MVVPAWSYWKALSYTEAPCHARRRSFSRLIDQPNEMRPVRKCAKPVTSVNLVNLFRKSVCFQWAATGKARVVVGRRFWRRRPAA